MYLLSHKVNTSPSGKTILELNYSNDQRILVKLNTFYPVEADFYILFLPGHRVMMEALTIMDDVELDAPISFDHAQFLVTDFFAGFTSNEEYAVLSDAVEAAFQEAWPHVPTKS